MGHDDFHYFYHPLKIPLAIQWNILLHKHFGCITVIYEYLEHIGLFTCNCHNSSSTELDFVLQYATNIIKSNLHMKKSNWSVCFKSECNSFTAKYSNFVFTNQEIDKMNYKHRCFQVETCCELKLANHLSLKNHMEGHKYRTLH